MAEIFFASAAANTVGTTMTDYLVKPIERRIRYLFRFRNIVEELHQSQKYLQIEQTRLKEDVKEAKSQNQVIEDYVEEWLTNAEIGLKNAQSLEGRIEEDKRCFRWFPNWSWRYRLSKEMEKKIQDMKKLVQDSHFVRIGHPAQLPNLDLVTPKDHVGFKSSEVAFDKTMEALKDDHVKKIGVWGMGGVGKTTLVKKVGGEVKGFDRVIMVTVSATPDIEKIQQKIADEIKLEFKTKSEVKAAELWNRLNGGKFLIILDDLWHEWDDDKDLKKIGIPLVKNGKGCKIILTTRRWKVCQSMECQETVPVDVLDGDEAWALFKMKANIDDRSVSKDIIKEAKKVAEECKGLPVAIVALASALKGNKTPKAWQLARKQLERSRLPEISNIAGEGEKNAYRCIEMSYQYLKEEATKRCFLLCALYPEDHSINVEDLVRYAWGLELYRNTESIDDMRTQVLGSIDQLKDSCLLLEADDERCIKLHDIIRDVALWIASEKESSFMMKTRLELLHESSESCKAISLWNNEEIEFSTSLVHSKLEIFLLKNCNVQGTCFLEMRELKVLSLSVPHNSMRIFSLRALASLQKLRALHLENLEDLSFLGNLNTLEILSLRGSGLEGLGDELDRLGKLKILDLTGCTFSSRFPSNVIRKLSELEELYLNGSNMEEVIDDIFVEISFLSGLTVLSLEVSSFHFREDFTLPGKLERYDISISAVNKSCSIHFTEKSWEIKGVIPLNLFYLLPENLESLKVSDNLKLTDLSSISELPTQTVTLEGLVELSIDNCPSLKSLFSLSTAQRLGELSIDNCPSLKSLFSVSVAQSLVLLQILKISHCHGLRQLVTELEGDDDEEEEISPSMINSHHDSLCFPKLDKLEIRHCDGLEYIFPTSVAPEGLWGLSLTVLDCSQLKQVIRLANDRVENDIVFQQQLQSLRSLQEFSVRSCPQLNDSVVQLEADEADLLEVQLSAFKKSFNTSKHLRLWDAIEDRNMVPEANEDGLDGLTSLYLMDCKDLECLVDTTTGKGRPSSAFRNLERLGMSSMEGLERLCKGQPPQGFLNNLKQLDVASCDMLQVLFQWDEHSLEENQAHPLSNLQSLELWDLPELRWIWKGSFTLQSLKVVKIQLCSKLESLFSRFLVSSLVLLEGLEIRKCHDLKTLFAESENDGEILESKSCSNRPLCLPKFKTLDISECPKLEYIVPVTLAQCLPALESVKITKCKLLKQVISMGKGGEEDGVDHHPDICNMLLPSFQHLYLVELKNLISFVPENYVVEVPGLKSVTVEKCRKIRNFPIQQQQANNKQLELSLQGKGSMSIFKDLSCITKGVILEKIHHLKNVVSDVVDLEHLQGLTSLHISWWEKCESLIDTSQAAMSKRHGNQPIIITLSNLQHLRLDLLKALRWIVKCPTHFVNLQSLKVLEISMCWKLEYLFPTSIVQTLRSLEELKINDCHKLKSVFMEYLETEDDGIQQESKTICSFPNLKTLEITACPRLEHIFQLALAPGLPHLQKVQLVRLSKLRSIVAGNNFLEAPALEILDIQHCPAFTIFILHKQVNNSSTFKELTFSMSDRDSEDAESYNVANIQLRQTSPDLECLNLGKFEQLFQLQGGHFISSLEKVKLEHMISLRDIWKGPINVAVNLRELEVHDCNSLTYIFPMKFIQHLPQLRTLKMKLCHNMKQIIANDDILASSSSSSEVLQSEKKMTFPQLKEIVLGNLLRLESFVPVGYHLEFPCLELLDVEQCPKMITSFSVDYLTLIVHAKTNQAISQADDASPSQQVVHWKRNRFSKGLPQYVEDA